MEPDQEASTGRREPPVSREAQPVRARHVAARDGHEAGKARLGSQQVVVALVQCLVAEPVADREQAAGTVEQEGEGHLGHQRAALLGQVIQRAGQRDALRGTRSELLQRDATGQHGEQRLGQQLAQVAQLRLDVAAGHLQPADHRGRQPRHRVLQQAGDILRGRLQCASPLGQGGDAGAEAGTDQAQRRHQLLAAARRPGVERLGLSNRIQAAGERIHRAGQRARRQQRAGLEGDASLAQGQQVPGEVAAVDGGYVARCQRC
jgi:hypothetical protein